MCKPISMLNVNYNFTKKDNVILTNGGKGEMCSPLGKKTIVFFVIFLTT